MKEPMMSVVALVLAGGPGMRMGLTGTRIPKVYLPVGLEPVINRPIKRALEIDSIEKIYPLTRRSHPERKDVDLEAWAEDWYSKYFKGKHSDRVCSPLYEEDLEKDLGEDLPSPPVGQYGAIVALFWAAQYLRKRSQATHVLILLGDNFIDQSIKPILDASSDYPGDVIIATRTLSNRSQARRRFGVVEVSHKKESANRVFGYEEKPEDPRTAEASIGLYLFPLERLQLLTDYFSELETGDLSPSEQYERAGAPGHFIGWLVRGGRVVRAVPFEGGHWIDVGTPSSLLASIVQVTQELVDHPKSARELDVLGTTENLSDRFYFLCQRACVTRDSNGSAIELYFEGEDSITALSGGDGQRVIPIQKVRDDSANKNAPFWDALTKNGQFGTHLNPDELDAPILMSGGVFLLDRGAAPTWQFGWGLLPFFIRDFGAPVDAGRLTTAAGRMDKLDILDVCVSEHSEEMIFLGTNFLHSSEPRMLICAPPDWRAVARESTLERIQLKRLLLPGIDPRSVAHERKSAIGLVAEPETYPLQPPPEHAWTVRIFYRESSDDNWSIRHEYHNFVLIPDVLAATLEFRVIWLASITLGAPGPDEAAESGSVGRLLGIVDGDGYHRTAVIVRAHDLTEYVASIEAQRLTDVLFRSDVETGPGLDVLAATDGSGRFSSFGRRLPVAPLTTSVRYLVDLLPLL